MRHLFLRVALCLLAVAWGGHAADTAVAEPQRDTGPLAIPTFHCLGLYWSPPGGAADKAVRVRYRRQGDAAWKEGLPMRYNPIAKTDEELADYRGSIVHLAPATPYEVQLTLADTAVTTHFVAKTWSEDFPIGETVRVGNRDTPLAITESGTAQAWRVYDGRGATIDVRHQDRPVSTGARQSGRGRRPAHPQLQRWLHRRGARHRGPPAGRAADEIRHSSQSALRQDEGGKIMKTGTAMKCGIPPPQPAYCEDDARLNRLTVNN